MPGLKANKIKKNKWRAIRSKSRSNFMYLLRILKLDPEHNDLLKFMGAYERKKK